MQQPEWRERLATLQQDGWELESGEERHRKYGEKFWIPSAEARANLRSGQSVRLLFQIEGEDEDGTIELTVERMWAIVVGRDGDFYLGILDNQPASIEAGHLDEGTEFLFAPEHVIDVDDPPRDYLVEKYGERLGLN